jgi:outer membrane protein TolC
LSEAQAGLRDGSALNVDVLDGQAGLLQSEQSLLTIDLHLSDLNVELNDLLGFPLDTRLVLSPEQVNASVDLSREEMLRVGFATNPEIASAVESIEQAKAAVKAAKSAYIPDISVYARQSYENGVPFLPRNFGTFGVLMNYDVFDFGKRRAAVREREAQLAQAQENVERLKQAVAVVKITGNQFPSLDPASAAQMDQLLRKSLPPEIPMSTLIDACRSVPGFFPPALPLPAQQLRLSASECARSLYFPV